jgi:hypothetical protein
MIAVNYSAFYACSQAAADYLTGSRSGKAALLWLSKQQMAALASIKLPVEFPHDMLEVWGGFVVAGAGFLAPDGDGQTLPAACVGGGCLL